MKSIRSTLALLTLTGILLCGDQLHGQLLPHRSEEGAALASREAISRLGPDATLVMIGAIGDTIFNNASMRIDPDRGEASAWAYFFYSPTRKEWSTVATFDVMGGGLQAMPTESPVQIPEGLTVRIDTALPFASSGQLPARLKGNPTFEGYRADLPDVEPNRIAFRQPTASDSAALPDAFLLDAPLWTLLYRGAGDTMMTCWVSGRTGESFCVRGNAAASVSGDPEPARAQRIGVIPNPAGDLIQVVVVPPAGRSASEKIEVALYGSAGQRSLAPNSIERSGDRIVATFDPSSLPAGEYYCHIAGNGWSDSIGIGVRR
jgi:hypothetical protein